MNKDELAEERTDLAEERTSWADQRTYLAEQRTFSGWIRTGLASLAVGLGTVEFLGKTKPEWLISSIGLALIILGGVIPFMAFWNYRKSKLKMKKTKKPGSSIPDIWLLVITTGLVLASMGGIIMVFLGNNSH